MRIFNSVIESHDYVKATFQRCSKHPRGHCNFGKSLRCCYRRKPRALSPPRTTIIQIEQEAAGARKNPWCSPEHSIPQHWLVHHQVLQMVTPPHGSPPLTSHHTRHDHQTTSSSTITLSCHLDHSNRLSTAPSIEPPRSSRWCDLITPCLGTLPGSHYSENEAPNLTVAFKDLHLLAPPASSLHFPQQSCFLFFRVPHSFQHQNLFIPLPCTPPFST